MTRMRRDLGVVLFVTLAGLAGNALAQNDPDRTPSLEGNDDVPARDPAYVGESPGLRVSDSLAFHPEVGISTGYQTNVLFRDSKDPDGGPVGSGILRLGVGAAVATVSPSTYEAESPSGTPPAQKVAFRGDIDLTWNQYIATSDSAKAASDLGIGAILDARFNPQGTVTFTVRDGFVRAVTPPHVAGDESIDRDKNEALVGIAFAPGGGAIQAYLNYLFGLDLFERDTLDFANRMWHVFTLGGKYQFLPKTQFNLEAQLGIVGPISGAAKSSSLPLRITAGASTLITPTFGTVLRIGYGNGFYDAGASFNSYLAMAEGRYAIGPTTRVAFGYERNFQDSVFANYYADHAIYGRFAAQFGGRLQLTSKAEVRLRSYGGINTMAVPGYTFAPTRSDVLARLEGAVDYPVNQWLALGAAYTFASDSTDFFVDGPGGRDYGAFVWQEFVVKASAKF